MGDGRPSGELLLANGTLNEDNPADCLSVQVGQQSLAAFQLCPMRGWRSGTLNTNCPVTRGKCKFLKAHSPSCFMCLGCVYGT